MSESLYDKAPFCFFSFSDDGSLQELNETLCALLGKSRNELKGANVESILTIPTRIFFQTHFYPLVKMQGFAEEIFVTLLTSDGDHLPVLLNAKRMEADAGAFTSCACIVVRNRKKFEDELVAAKKTAEKALLDNSNLAEAKQKLQHYAKRLEEQMQTISRQNSELQQMNHAVTHNLKEPLRKIQMYTSRLSSIIEHPDLDKLNRAAEQMKVVVSGLQEFVWLNDRENHFVEVDLSEVVAVAMSKLGEQSKNIELRIDAMPALQGDHEQLVMLFYHLLSNALKFKKGDTARVLINGIRLKKNSFRSLKDEYAYEDFIKVEVTDLGVGFDRTYRENIFELFNKQHYGPGQGIGLALCKKIAANHNGYIEADSKINMSTTVTIWFPLVQVASESGMFKKQL